MMQDLLTSLDSVTGLLVLGAIAFGDTLIGLCFFVFGEVAFLAAGAAFAADGAVLPAVVVLSAAFAGDAISYTLGKIHGPRSLLPFLKTSKRRRAWRRAQQQLARRGPAFIVAARFLGPVAWVTPFLAGTLDMPKRSFLPAAALGVLLGVGQFLIYGAFGTAILSQILPFLMAHLGIVLLSAAILLSALFLWRSSKRSRVTRAVQITTLGSLVFLISNVAYFFVLDSHAAQSAPRTTFASVCDAAQGPFLVTPGDTDLHLPQPVNVILLSDAKGADLMAELGWHRNMTFTHDEIGLAAYLKSLFQRTPPVSELYLDGVPADSAHQMSGTIKVREHVRWWDMGAGVHLGAISKTEEIAIKYYSHLPVLLHDIDPKVDESRDLLASQVTELPTYQVLGFAPLAPRVLDGVVADYETDGRVLVIAPQGTDTPPEILDCLRLNEVA